MGKKSRRGNNKKARAPPTNGQQRVAPPITTLPRDCYVVDGKALLATAVEPTVDINNVVDAVLSRGLGNKHLRARPVLTHFFQSLDRSGKMKFLTTPLLEALVFPRKINQLVGIPGSGEPWPLLVWVCQCKWLYHSSGGSWKGGDDIVDMVLRAGADINHVLRNKTNALFFAVKYGTLTMVNLLLEAGINFRQVDYTGCTCLINALEHPNPEIVSRLLELLPATATSEVHVGQDDGSITLETGTMPDAMLRLFIRANTVVSWEVLGAPAPDTIMETLHILRKNGARFSLEANVALRGLGHMHRTDENLDTHSTLRAPETFKELAKYLIGSYIPESSRPLSAATHTQLSLTEKDRTKDGEKDKEGTCPICLNPVSKSVDLYCGHKFCRKCILEYAADSTSLNPPPGCPVCRRQLCPELLSSSSADTSNLNDVVGIREISPAGKGPKFMTDDQILAEAKYQGVDQSYPTTEALRSKLQEDFLLGCEDATQDRETAIVVDVSSGSISRGNGLFSVNPVHGPVCVEVVIEGVPLLAYVSNRSLYTVIAQPVVEMLRLQKIEELQSTKFVDIVALKKMGKEFTFTCLKPVSIRVGEDIDVTLHTAVEMSPDKTPDQMYGIQLGQDFLSSGRWCPMDVEVDFNSDGNTVARVDRGLSWVENALSTAGEMLRFYADDGKMAFVPLLHFSPFNKDYFPAITLKDTVQFQQCSWCCLTFPEGMLSCPQCDLDSSRKVFYCDKECQLAAWKVHKRRCGKSDECDA